MKMSHIDDGTLHEYLDGELNDRRRADVEAHIADCIACAERLESAESLIGRASGLMSELEPEASQPPPWTEIEERAAARAARAPRKPRVGPWLAWAASIVLAFGVGWLSHSSWPVWGDRMQSPASQTVQPSALPVAVEFEERPNVTGEAFDDRASAIAVEETSLRSLADQVEDQQPVTSTVGAEPAAPPSRGVPEQIGRELAEADRDDLARRGGEGEAAEAKEVSADETPAEPAVDHLRDDVTRERRELTAAKADVPADAEFAAPMAQVSAEAEANEVGRFFAVQPDEAAEWLGHQLRTLPDLQLQRVEVGPGAALEDGVLGLPAVRLIYLDAANNEIVLTMQQASAEQAREKDALDAVLIGQPSGMNVYRWYEEGYLLTLAAEVSGDSLRALAERVR
jgi:anti-sigma factor RsiW